MFNLTGSVAERVKALFLRPRCEHDRVIIGLTPTLGVHVVESLDKELYNDYLCLVASNKQQKKETTIKLGNGQLLSGCGFVQNISPPSLSRDRRIKMEQTNNKLTKLNILRARKAKFFFLYEIVERWRCDGTTTHSLLFK